MKFSALEDATDHISEEAVANSATAIVPEGSILVVARSGILVHSIPIAQVKRPLAFNQDIKALIPDPRKVDPDYLFWFVRGREQELLTRGVKKGATVHSLQSGVIENLSVPLPSFARQEEIVDLLAHAEGVVRLRHEAQKKAAEIIPALFIDMFGDPATNPKGWPETMLREIVEEFRYGTSQKSGDSGLPVLRIPNVIGDRLNPQDMKLVDIPPGEAKRLRLREGDILFVRTNGNPDYVGRNAVFEGEIMEQAGFDASACIYASYLIRARLIQTAIAPRFLQAFLASSEGRRRLRERARTSAGQYNINTEGLSQIRILLPPLRFQEDFAARCGEVYSVIGLQKAAMAKAEAVFQATLANAFFEKDSPIASQGEKRMVAA
jgi:type I restriction enzyme S subunit